MKDAERDLDVGKNPMAPSLRGLSSQNLQHVRGASNLTLHLHYIKSSLKTTPKTTVVLHILRKRAAEAGVSSFSPDHLRRSFIIDLLDAGAFLSASLAGSWLPEQILAMILLPSD
jgi:integrase